MPRIQRKSALGYILRSMVPYSRENLLLAYKPNRFFNELERISEHKRSTLKNAYWRGRQQGYIEEIGGSRHLTAKGLEVVKPYVAKRLGKAARLLVIFDVPEQDRSTRQRLRELLKSWEFEQIQKSVWATDRDYRELLVDAIAELGLGGCVEIYESVRLFPKGK